MGLFRDLLIRFKPKKGGESDDKTTDYKIKQLFNKILDIYELAKLENKSDRFSFFRDRLIQSDELEVFDERIHEYGTRSRSIHVNRMNTQNEFIKNIFDDLKVIKSKTDKKSYVLLENPTEEYKHRERKDPTEEERNDALINYFRSQFFLMAIDTPTNKKDLKVFLEEINPYCDPDEAKIEIVLEEYKKYKELDSGEEDLQKKQECKTALKQAIDDALKTDMLTLHTIDLAKSISAKHDLENKINLALNSQSDKPTNPGSEGIEINLVPFDQPSESKFISPDALESILFYNKLMDDNKVQIITPKITLTSVEEFKNFLVENGGTNLNERLVNEAFEAYETYYKEALSQQNYELLQRLQKGTTTKVLDHEFNGIVSFLDRMPKAELNASSAVNKPLSQKSAQGASMDELEPPPEVISASNIKRDKVAEFEKFLKKIDPNFKITKNEYDKILSQYYEYKKYEEKFKTRKTDTSNLGLISELTESETTLKNLISSCLHLSEKTKLPTFFKDIPYNEPKPYEINNKDFDEVLKYLEYEQIKAYYEQNPPTKIKYDPPPNDTLDDLFKPIRDLPSNILKTFRCIRADDSSDGKKDPTNARK